MAFDGPDATDYDNVLSLNLAYLEALSRDESLQHCLTDMAEISQQRLLCLDRAETARLASTPFLLFSFHEFDDAYWNSILADSAGRDLFAAKLSKDADTIVSAGLGFIWQLAQRNPYALRVICGSTLYWCERIAELTFYRLLDAVRCSGVVPSLRLAHQNELWRKLLSSGVCRDNTIRQSAQMSALQLVLTRSTFASRESWPQAARSARAPGLRVAEETDR